MTLGVPPLVVLLGAASLALASSACNLLDPQFGALQPASGDLDGGGTDISFALDIRPLMNRSETDPTGHGCKKCHYSTEPSHVGYDLGGLDLSTLGALRKGGATSGASIVVAGSPEESVIVQKLKGTYGFGARMPKDGPAFWSDADIAKVESWIQDGAKGADDE